MSQSSAGKVAWLPVRRAVLIGAGLGALMLGGAGHGLAQDNAPSFPLGPITVSPPPATAPAAPGPAAPAAVAPGGPPGTMATPLEQSRAAIEECRERRLRHELPSYQASAECSSPKIFAAWREAGYQHLDLITAWLNAREQASAEVDQKRLTPKDFETRMAELTIRLTAEENRRRSGAVSTPDNALQLQLPPASQVMAVATPAGKDKIARKKTEQARLAAATPRIDPSSGNETQYLGTLPSGVDSKQKPGAKPPSGVGGPFVPAPPGYTGSTGQRLSANATGGNGYYAHLASQRSETDAKTAYRMLQNKFPAILGERDAVIRRADSGADGTYYRVEIGPLSAGQADQLCGTLKAAGGSCAAHFE
jgi:hypothetical protein